MLRAPVAPGWQRLLDAAQVRSFRFEGRSGSFTARAEERSGATYWYAYRKVRGRLHKEYLGRTTELDEQRLEHAAARLVQSGGLAPERHGSVRETLPRSSGRHYLPVRASTLIGRSEEVAELRRRLRGARIVTLTGAAGIGKTRLALATATAVEASHRDGARFVDLSDVSDPAMVTASVADAIDVREQPSRDLLSVVLEALRPLECLLVLDNCEHLLDCVGRLVLQIMSTCPQVRVLATSRERLGCEGELVWTVPPFALASPDESVDSVCSADGIRLFAERAAEVDPRFRVSHQNAAVVARICNQLDGLPLAIELAAARVPALGLEELEARLGDRLQLLRHHRRTPTPRQQSLRAALDWSFSLLTRSEQTLFDRLSVFAGGWTLQAVEAITAGPGLNGDDIVDQLGALRSKSLIVTVPLAEGLNVRYRMLETLRQYGREHLLVSGEADAVHCRHADYFLALADAVEAEQHIWGMQPRVVLDRLEDELENVRAALRWAVDHARTDTAMRLGAAVWHMWYSRGHYAEGRRWIAEILAMPDARARPALKATLLNAAGMLAHRQADFRTARALEEEALAIGRDLRDNVQVAIVLSSLGISALHQADYAASRRFFNEALALAGAAGDRAHEVQALIQLASVECHASQYSTAYSIGAEALANARVLASPYLMAYALRTLGFTAVGRGDLATATAYLQEGLALARRMGDQWLVGETLEGLGHVAASMRQYVRARGHLLDSLHLYRPLGDLRVVRSLEGLARVAFETGCAEGALRLGGACAQLRATWGYPAARHEQRILHAWIDSARRGPGSSVATLAWEGGHQLSLDQAIDLAECLSSGAADTAPSASTRADLTRRESEVLRLLAFGHSNQEIAAGLTLSVNTVERHLANIYSKIGARRRGEAIAYALSLNVREVR